MAIMTVIKYGYSFGDPMMTTIGSFCSGCVTLFGAYLTQIAGIVKQTGNVFFIHFRNEGMLCLFISKIIGITLY